MIFLDAGSARVASLGFSADGSMLYAHTHKNETFSAWQGPGYEQMTTPAAASLQLEHLLMYGDDARFVGIDKHGRIIAFDMPLSKVPTRKTFIPVNATALAIDPDGELLCVACQSVWEKPEIRRFNLKSRKELQPLRGHDRNILSLAFSADGETLVSGCQGGMIRFWDAHKGKERRGTIELFSEGRIVDGLRQSIQQFVWMPTPEFEQDQLVNKAGVRALAYSFEDDMLAAGTGRSVGVWKLQENGTRGTRHALLKGHAGLVNGVAFSPDGDHLASASRDGSVKVWDIESAKLRQTYQWDIGGIQTVCYAPDGLRLACGSATGKVVVWDAE